MDDRLTVQKEYKRNQSLQADYKVIILELIFFTILCLGEFNPFNLPFGNTVIILLFACYSLWIRGLSWRSVGLVSPLSRRTAILFGVVAFFLIVPTIIWVILPSATWLTGKAINLSAFEALRDNLPFLLQNIALVWIFAAFTEEMIFRGYLMNRLADLFGKTPTGYIITLILSNVVFGAAHSYQGLTGMINAGIIGFLLGSVYLLSKRNLWAVIICHGLIDTAFIVLVYLNRDGNLFT